ncbi:MAG: hypothetical protein ACC661_12510, partial [Verrucomicrobiales bacterium]
FDIDPGKIYTVVVPWPFTNRDIRRYRNRLPPREEVDDEDPVPGLVLADPEVLGKTTREMLVEEGTSEGLDFYGSRPRPASDWEAWTKYFEAKMKNATP